MIPCREVPTRGMAAWKKMYMMAGTTCWCICMHVYVMYACVYVHVHIFKYTHICTIYTHVWLYATDGVGKIEINQAMMHAHHTYGALWSGPSQLAAYKKKEPESYGADDNYAPLTGFLTCDPQHRQLSRRLPRIPPIPTQTRWIWRLNTRRRSCSHQCKLSCMCPWCGKQVCVGDVNVAL